ncbi:hypothetical protein NUW54_g4285 [Trametes sanguinea]|uniref:Uncharacterized protein n=1 Tax=Trametes sanguinea TaxID=158606 RepID=A0ACC1Q1F8_9APHY|nr:hypothetical protein NUW54_g4285 [Trametes sanguinea]
MDTTTGQKLYLSLHPRSPNALTACSRPPQILVDPAADRNSVDSASAQHVGGPTCAFTRTRAPCHQLWSGAQSATRPSSRSSSGRSLRSAPGAAAPRRLPS